MGGVCAFGGGNKIVRSVPPAAVQWAVWIYDNNALRIKGLGEWKCFLGRGEVRGFL